MRPLKFKFRSSRSTRVFKFHGKAAARGKNERVQSMFFAYNAKGRSHNQSLPQSRAPGVGCHLISVVLFGPTRTEYVWPIKSEYRTLPAPESRSSVARCHSGTASLLRLCGRRAGGETVRRRGSVRLVGLDPPEGCGCPRARGALANGEISLLKWPSRNNKRW